MSPLTDIQIGYLAGLLDGEGHLSIVKNVRNDDKKRLRNYQLRAEVRITQARRRLLETITEWIGQENCSIGWTGREQKYSVLRFKAQWLRDNLPILIPHLILKSRQAEIVLWFLHRPKWVGRKGIGEEAWAERDRLHMKCKSYNELPRLSPVKPTN